MFYSQSGDAASAAEKAYSAMFGMIRKQAAMIAYNDVFRILMWLFVIMLPFIFLMKRPRRGGGPGMAH